MLAESYPYFLANKPERPNTDLEVVDKYTGEVATRVAMAGSDAIDRAIEKAVEAAEPMREMAAYERQTVLSHCVHRFSERADELAESLCIEAGKPIKDSRGEVSRLIDTFRVAAAESVRMVGEVVGEPLGAEALIEGKARDLELPPELGVALPSPFEDHRVVRPHHQRAGEGDQRALGGPEPASAEPRAGEKDRLHAAAQRVARSARGGHHPRTLRW